MAPAQPAVLGSAWPVSQVWCTAAGVTSVGLRVFGSSVRRPQPGSESGSAAVVIVVPVHFRPDFVTSCAQTAITTRR